MTFVGFGGCSSTYFSTCGPVSIITSDFPPFVSGYKNFETWRIFADLCQSMCFHLGNVGNGWRVPHFLIRGK